MMSRCLSGTPKQNSSVSMSIDADATNAPAPSSRHPNGESISAANTSHPQTGHFPNPSPIFPTPKFYFWSVGTRVLCRASLRVRGTLRDSALTRTPAAALPCQEKRASPAAHQSPGLEASRHLAHARLWRTQRAARSDTVDGMLGLTGGIALDSSVGITKPAPGDQT